MNKLFESRFKIKLISTEIELAKEAKRAIQADNDDREASLKLLEKQLKETEWECKDIASLKDAR